MLLRAVALTLTLSSCMLETGGPEDVLEFTESAVEDCGRLLVSDRGANLTVELDACDGREVWRHADVTRPSAAVRHPDGRLFVTSFATGGVYCGEAEPFYRNSWYLQEPVAMRWRDGRLWVLGRDTRHFAVLSERGVLLDVVGGSDLEHAHDFVWASDDRLYVTTSWNGDTDGRVQVWDPVARALVDDFGPELGLPTGIDEGPDGWLYVADWQEDRVVRFDRAGVRDAAFELALEAPLGLAVAPGGTLFVSSGGAVWRVDEAGARRLAELDDPRGITYVR